MADYIYCHPQGATITNSTLYSTTLYTEEAGRIIAAHAQQQQQQQQQHNATSAAARPLFLYLPYQAVHVGNKVTPAHPEYGLDQAPARYIEPYLTIPTTQAV